MIDTHAHLDACAEPADEILRRAREAGVGTVVAVGSGIESCRETLAICEREENVYAALGIHPHQAGEAGRPELVELRGLIGHPKVVAVGETGLDYYRDYASRERQRELFRAQAALAAELDKALVVHSRDAADETAAILAEVAGDARVVLHCFSTPALLAPALAEGYYVSFAGNVTYPKAPELREAAGRVPADRLLAETDSPYLAPQPVRGRPNEPAFVAHTVAALAAARDEDCDDLERRTDANAGSAFRLP